MKETLSILHLEDDEKDAALIENALHKAGLSPSIKLARGREEFLAAFGNEDFDVILSDSRVPGMDGTAALQHARKTKPETPFIFVSGFADGEAARDKLIRAGAAECVHKTDLDWLAGAILGALQNPIAEPTPAPSPWYVHGMERLIAVVQELSLARSLPEVMAVVRHAARELTDADGATFVLREGECCHYADEDAIAPLWKGRRFPMNVCISGWVMLNRQPVVIENIYEDDRIPADAYRPTFVKSLVMVPIRTAKPVGAIGTYWATHRSPRPEEVELLQALANSTSIAMENVQLYQELEQKVMERTARLKAVNEELESFSYSVSHDLRAPLRHIQGYTDLLRDHAKDSLDAKSRRCLASVSEAAQRMSTLIDDLLDFSRMGRTPLQAGRVDMNQLVAEARLELAPEIQSRKINWKIGALPTAHGDRAMLKQVWLNLLSNAVKYTRKATPAKIIVGAKPRDNETEYFVQDNGVGFDMQYADKLFGVFQRLHRVDQFDGSGLGLANVRRIITRHGGRTWAEAELERGAMFHFTLPVANDQKQPA